MEQEIESKSFDFTGDAWEFFSLFKDRAHAFFLDSSLVSESSGRFSFIGFEPFEIFRSCDNTINSLEDLRKISAPFFLKDNAMKNGAPFPFFSGLVGYIGYDAGLALEKLSSHHVDDLGIPNCFFGFYDSVIAIDHFAGKLHVVATGLGEKNASLQKKRAQDRLNEILKILSAYHHKSRSSVADDSVFSFADELLGSHLASNFTKEEYLTAIRKALEHIRKGDIYQVNLAQRFLFDACRYGFDICPTELYAMLRRFSPSCFGGYLNGGNFQILSSSPELFLKNNRGLLQTRPMKGTRRRGDDTIEDEALCRELLDSNKEKAELLMVTDLERNDLGRVCRYGSVRVHAMRTLESYKTVFQTTATIEGELAKDKNCFDALEACFPSGSVTGCPKIRAIEIIDTLEPSRRSFYTGAMGYIDFRGDMQFNVLIRTLLLKEQKIYFYTGGGIVADSLPEKEYEETLIKSKAMCRAIAASSHLKVQA